MLNTRQLIFDTQQFFSTRNQHEFNYLWKIEELKDQSGVTGDPQMEAKEDEEETLAMTVKQDATFAGKRSRSKIEIFGTKVKKNKNYIIQS